MIPPINSLVKYDNPILVSTTKDRKGRASKARNGGKGKPPPVELLTGFKPQVSQTEDILNSILPPREWTEDGQLWVQYVSSTPATRHDVINLQGQLDERLRQRQARETGICPIREELYSQCFDEIIRQVTIISAERGLLLLRVRDEIRMSAAAYQTGYESSVAFGMRKALQSEQGKYDMEAKIKQLEQEKMELERQVHDNNAKCEASERRFAQEAQASENKHNEVVATLRKTNAMLKQDRDNVLNPTPPAKEEKKK